VNGSLINFKGVEYYGNTLAESNEVYIGFSCRVNIFKNKEKIKEPLSVGNSFICSFRLMVDRKTRVVTKVEAFNTENSKISPGRSYQIFYSDKLTGNALKRIVDFESLLNMDFISFIGELNGNREIIFVKAGLGEELGRYFSSNEKVNKDSFLLRAYVGLLKYGSPENYLKQVIASRKAF
jgi:hypothetical protein